MTRARVFHASLALLLITCFACSIAEAAKPFAAFRRVRPLDPGVGDLLARGYAESATFRSLISVLERSDVIVHIEQVSAQGNGLAGATRFITRTGDTRYVRITIYGVWATDRLIALLGHELQHAVEIASAGWVVDQVTCLELFHEIGRRTCTPDRLCFDTDAAVLAGVRVWRELQMETE